jgi:hypothetical protein
MMAFMHGDDGWTDDDDGVVVESGDVWPCPPWWLMVGAASPSWPWHSCMVMVMAVGMVMVMGMAMVRDLGHAAHGDDGDDGGGVHVDWHSCMMMTTVALGLVTMMIMSGADDGWHASWQSEVVFIYFYFFLVAQRLWLYTFDGIL